MRVSELIKINDVCSWNKGDIVNIRAGTGSGKSHFIKNTLYEYAKEHNKRILMLIHRRNTVDQFKSELKREKKLDVVSVSTYQSIEISAQEHKRYPFSQYDYIVCDEFHYFMSDANFNKYTDISLDEILKRNGKIRIFMSATGDYMNQYMEEVKGINPIKYNLPIDYKFIKTLNFFYSEKILDQLIQEFINTGQKAVFFIKSAKLAYELHYKYKYETLFNCSRDNKKYFKYVNQDEINDMLDKEKFKSQILITTMSLDTGVNINDGMLSNIVIGGIFDIGTIIQCIGRKRINNKDEFINLYIQSYSNKSLGGFKSQMKSRIEKAESVRKHGTEAYVIEYGRNTNDNIIYDKPVYGEDKVIKEINEMIFFKNRVDIVEINKMLNLGDYGFSKYIAKMFEKYVDEFNYYDYRVIDLDNKNNDLELYLESIVGKVMLTPDDRDELIEKINVRDGNNNRLLKNINTLNATLEENGLDYLISNFETSRMVDGKKKKYKSAWKVRKIVD